MQAPRRHRRAAGVAGLATLLLAAGTPTTANARAITLAWSVDFYPAPQLVVGARGDALAAWPQDDDVVGGEKDQRAAMVFAAVRRPGQRFAKARRISDPTAGIRSFTTAVGAGGHGAVAWQPDTATPARLRVRLLAPQGDFGRSIPLPGSVAGADPVAAIDPRGRLLVAWLRPGRDGCGRFVMAIVVSRSGRAGRPRRASERCAHATLVRVALARDGTGAVAWRSEGARTARSNSVVRVSAFAGGRLRSPRTVSRAPKVGATLALAAGAHRALVVWRDTGAGRHDIRGRVLAVAIHGPRIAPPVAVNRTAKPLLGDVHAAMNVHDAAIVGWAQARRLEYEPYTSSHVAIRSGARGPFTAQTTLVRNLEPHAVAVALDAAGRGIAAFAGDLVRRRGLTGQWRRTVSLEDPSNTQSDDEDVEVGAPTGGDVGCSDAGECIAMWDLAYDQGDVLRVRVLAPPGHGVAARAATATLSRRPVALSSRRSR